MCEDDPQILLKVSKSRIIIAKEGMHLTTFTGKLPPQREKSSKQKKKASKCSHNLSV